MDKDAYQAQIETHILRRLNNELSKNEDLGVDDLNTATFILMNLERYHDEKKKVLTK